MAVGVEIGSSPRWRRRRGQRREPLVRSALNLMTSTLVGAGLGLPFWVLAARAVPAETLGRDAALITTLMSLATIASLNCASGVARFVPRLGHKTARTLGLTYVVVIVSSLLAGTAFVLVAPAVDGDLAYLRADVGIALLYVAGIAIWSSFALQDVALTALRHARWVPVANGLYGALKIAAIPLGVALGARHAVFAAWVLAALALVVPVTWLVFRRAVPRHVAEQAASVAKAGVTTEGFSRRGLGRFLAADYAGMVFYQTSLLLLPLLVITSIGERENAFFAVSFTLVATFSALAHNAVMAFTVEGVLDEHRVEELMRIATRKLLLPLVGASALLIVAAPLLLLPFGSEYAANAAPVVRILACSTLFHMVVWMFEARCRLRGVAAPIAWVNALGLVLLILLALLLLPAYGAAGAGAAWLATNALLAVGVLPSLAGWRWTPSGAAVALVAAVRTGRSPALTTLALLACVLAPLTVDVGAPPAARFAATGVVLAVVPGVAVLGWLLTPFGRMEAGLVVATSLGVSTLTAQAMVSLGLWHPVVALHGLAAAGAAAIVVQRLRSRSTRTQSTSIVAGNGVAS